MFAARRFFHSWEENPREEETRDEREAEFRVGADVISIFIKHTRYALPCDRSDSIRVAAPLDPRLFIPKASRVVQRVAKREYRECTARDVNIGTNSKTQRGSKPRKIRWGLL